MRTSLSALLLLFGFGLSACAGGAEPTPGSGTVAVSDDADVAEAPGAAPGVDPETRRTFERIVATAEAEAWAEEDFGMVVQRVAENLLGLPYVDGLLDQGEAEALFVSLDRFDCVLYVENVLALARVIADGEPTFDRYAREVERLRYRDGSLSADAAGRGYCDRLHYFSDWIADNERRGLVRNVTEAAGGRPFDKEITFISEHRDAYPKLVGDDEAYACVAEKEADLASVPLFYIPQDEIEAHAQNLQAGDIIATPTDIDGLDVTHTGFVYVHPDGRRGFIHASLSGESKISDDLASYIQGNGAQIGIIVARATAPNS
jgi:hypothetical protein